MISTPEDLAFYLEADRYALGRTRHRPGIGDVIWKYQRLLRRVEFLENQRPQRPGRRLLLLVLKYRKRRLGIALGFDIPSNVFGAGLRINHFGNIVINGQARIGMWCDIHQGVNIGTSNSQDGEALVPRVGDNVWIGPGAKLFGAVEVGSGVVIGANAVVNRSLPPDTTCVGVPAKVVRDSGTANLALAASAERSNRFFDLHPQWQNRGDRAS